MEYMYTGAAQDGLVITYKGYQRWFCAWNKWQRMQPLRWDHLGLCERNSAWQRWLLTKPAWVCLALYYLVGWLQWGVKRQLFMWWWWSSLLHLNMSPFKARGPTFRTQFLWVIFPLLKCEYLVINGEFSFSPVGFLDIHTLPDERCRGEIWGRHTR